MVAKLPRKGDYGATHAHARAAARAATAKDAANSADVPGVRAAKAAKEGRYEGKCGFHDKVSSMIEKLDSQDWRGWGQQFGARQAQSGLVPSAG